MTEGKAASDKAGVMRDRDQTVAIVSHIEDQKAVYAVGIRVRLTHLQQITPLRLRSCLVPCEKLIGGIGVSPCRIVNVTSGNNVHVVVRYFANCKVVKGTRAVYNRRILLRLASMTLNSRSLALALFLIAPATLLAQATESSITKELQGMRALPTAQRPAASLKAAQEIRALPPGKSKVGLALGLAGLTTEVDAGVPTFTAVAQKRSRRPSTKVP